MNCLSCFSSKKSKKQSKGDHSHRSHRNDPNSQSNSSVPKKQKPETQNAEATSNTNQAENEEIAAQPFTFRDLAAATKNFRQECMLGEGGFGKVYKGTLQATGQVVAVKQLDRNAMPGNKDFLVEVAKLSHLQHPNLVNLIGYCADGDQRLLVYEFMPQGSIEDHLHGKDGEGKSLDWLTRMKIAYGAAQGLEYLHDKTDTPVIYRDLKSSNVLLDEQFNPKLSDIGLDKLEPLTNKKLTQSREMGTYGYSAPEYSRSGRLTPVSDVYSFGVLLLELITGRRVMDTTKSVDEQNLVSWAQPIFKEPKRYPELADPLLKKRFPERDLNQTVGIIAMCLQDEAGARPMMSDVVTTLSFLSMATPGSCKPPTAQDSESENESDQHDDDDDDDDDDEDDDADDGHNSSGSRSNSSRGGRSMTSNGESRSTRDYSRRSNYGSSSREDISSNEGVDSSSRRKESQSLIRRNYSEELEGPSDEAITNSTKSSVDKSSRKKGGDGSVSKSRKSLSRKDSRAAGESHSSVSSKKNSRRTRKVNENPQSSTGISQDASQLVHNH